ncbi:unnamed protein product [Phytophthora fragariaefolia]|uniref:Unnamed protein product n=1 Tax=Phytophthora fragariaefolia TaxID=1490495 RepID=A0A9W6YDU2_9STRA|nr:unnamed protein product [Phytophthora fragariaefolia]
MPWHEAVTTESLHPIFINLRLKDTIYIDRFEWDLNNSNNSPEQFAQVVCEDLQHGCQNSYLHEAAFRQNRKKIMADHPSTSAKDASKILGDMWQKLSEKKRARYDHSFPWYAYCQKSATNFSCCPSSYIPMTEMENQRRMNEWRMKENALNGIHTTLNGGIASAAPSASATPSQTSSPAVPGTPVLLAPRITPSVASSMDDVDDPDADEDDEDEEDDDDDTASATGISV